MFCLLSLAGFANGPAPRSYGYLIDGSVTPEKLGLPYAKFHRVATWTFSAADTWENMEFDLVIGNETNDIALLSSSTILINRSAHYEINGCVRPRWTGAANTAAIVATRVVFSIDGGSTWTEARCLQSILERVRQTSEVGTQHYIGSINVPAGARIKLQARVSSTAMLFAGWPGFDNPVSLTLNIFTGGSNL